MSFARGKEAQARKAAKANRPKNLVPKRTGASQETKGPARCEAHLKLVRAQKCIVSGSYIEVVSHHAQECFPMFTMAGRKVSDFLCVPITHRLHDPDTPGSLHKTNHHRWWAKRGINVYAWLRGFLLRHYSPTIPDVRAALEMITKQETAMRGKEAA